jgi:hypothetical protein
MVLWRKQNRTIWVSPTVSYTLEIWLARQFPVALHFGLQEELQCKANCKSTSRSSSISNPLILTAMRARRDQQRNLLAAVTPVKTAVEREDAARRNSSDMRTGQASSDIGTLAWRPIKAQTSQSIRLRLLFCRVLLMGNEHAAIFRP